jgi:hypothetical protein
MNIYQTLRTQLRSGKSTFILGAAILCFCTSATVMAYVVNFSGDWKLNESKSQLGEFGGRGAARSIKVVSSDANGIVIERTSTNQAGEATVRKENLTFDGKEVESTSTTNFGTSKRKSSAKWSDDGQAMIISSTTSFDRDGQTMERKQKETWKLADGGQTLVIESTSTGPNGDNTIKLVYEKAK